MLLNSIGLDNMVLRANSRESFERASRRGSSDGRVGAAGGLRSTEDEGVSLDGTKSICVRSGTRSRSLLLRA